VAPVAVLGRARALAQEALPAAAVAAPAAWEVAASVGTWRRCSAFPLNNCELHNGISPCRLALASGARKRAVSRVVGDALA
jgi:hypothetical protein